MRESTHVKPQKYLTRPAMLASMFNAKISIIVTCSIGLNERRECVDQITFRLYVLYIP